MTSISVLGRLLRQPRGTTEQRHRSPQLRNRARWVLLIAAPVEKPEVAAMPLTTGAASVEYDLHADW